MRLVLVAWLFIWAALGPQTADARGCGFRLYRSAVSGSYTFGAEHCVATARRKETTLTYVNPTAGTWYFVLTAFNVEAESTPSEQVSATLGDNQTVTFAWDAHDNKFNMNFQVIVY
jgi:hypothetical protein